MNGNWIKLNRQLLTSNIFSDAKTLQVFIWILLNANYAKRTLLNGLTLDVGQLCTSRERISNACNIPQSTIYRVLKRLEKCQTIVMKPDSHGTVIEVVNYRLFQHGEVNDGQQVDSKWTANGQQVDTERELKKLNKEIKDKSVQSDGLPTSSRYSKEFDSFWDIWPRRRRQNKQAAYRAFQKAKKKIDVPTLMGAVREFSKSNKARGEFCPMPSSWLNSECWLDDREAWNDGKAPIRPKRKQTEAEIAVLIESRSLQAKLTDLRSQGKGMTDEAEAIKQRMTEIET